jgi:broad specificity phosphatase PhoE
LKKTIYYYRHGETYYSSKNMLYGDKEYEALLTENGRRQVGLLGAELARRPHFDLHLVSPLPRAVQTATIIQTYLDTELLIEPALIEPIREKREDTWARIEGLVERLIKMPNENILLGTHGFICCCLASYFRGLSLRNMSFENPPTAGFGWIEIEDGQPKRGCRIVSSHLTPSGVAVSEAQELITAI